MHVTSHAAWQARCLLQVSSSDQLRRNVRFCPIRCHSNYHLTSSSADVHSVFSAATVSPDVAKEGASSRQSYEQSNNKVTTQRSTGASHVEPCYPEKTINCSDGLLDTAVFHLTLIAYRYFDSYQPDCRGVEGQSGLGGHLSYLPQSWVERRHQQPPDSNHSCNARTLSCLPVWPAVVRSHS